MVDNRDCLLCCGIGDLDLRNLQARAVEEVLDDSVNDTGLAFGPHTVIGIRLQNRSGKLFEKV